MTVEMCVLRGWCFSNQSEIASETPFSCDTVDREPVVSYTLLATVP